MQDVGYVVAGHHGQIVDLGLIHNIESSFGTFIGFSWIAAFHSSNDFFERLLEDKNLQQNKADQSFDQDGQEDYVQATNVEHRVVSLKT